MATKVNLKIAPNTSWALKASGSPFFASFVDYFFDDFPAPLCAGRCIV